MNAPRISSQDSAPNSGWFKATRSNDALELLKANPLALALIYLIGARANWHQGFNALGCELREALIGDFKEYGMTRQEYRTALAHLIKWGFVTTRSTNRGTTAKLADTRVFDVIRGKNHQPINHQTTSQQPPSNHKRRSESNEPKSDSIKGSLALLTANPKALRTVDLIERCKTVLGESEMSSPRCHSLWLGRAQSNPSKLERVLADTKAAARAGEIKTTAARYAQHRWKEFAP